MPNREHESGFGLNGVEDSKFAVEQLPNFAGSMSVLFRERQTGGKVRQPAKLLFQTLTPTLRVNGGVGFDFNVVEDLVDVGDRTS